MNGVAHLTVQRAGRRRRHRSTIRSWLLSDSVDDTPVAADDTAMMNEDEGTLSIDVLANDTHGDDPTTIVSAGADRGRSAAYRLSEQFRIDADDGAGCNGYQRHAAERFAGNQRHDRSSTRRKVDFNGTDHFSYTIQDADGETSTATVTVIVNPVNDAPVQSSTVSYTVVQGSFLDILSAGGIASHGFDADSDTISVVQDTAPTSIGMGYPGTTLGVAAGRCVPLHA